MKIKKGDKVKIICGDDKGKIGTVLKAYPKLNKVVVENVNVHKRHKKPNSKNNNKGSIVNINMPINVSNVVLFNSKTNKKYKVGYKIVDGKKIRFDKKTGEKI